MQGVIKLGILNSKKGSLAFRQVANRKVSVVHVITSAITWINFSLHSNFSSIAGVKCKERYEARTSREYSRFDIGL